MRDNMPQPTRDNDAVAFNEYIDIVWMEARSFYLRFALGASVVSATIGALAGYAFAGGFN